MNTIYLPVFENTFLNIALGFLAVAIIVRIVRWVISIVI